MSPRSRHPHPRLPLRRAQAPNEDFEITFLSDKRDEVLHTESAPYRLFKRGKENWIRIPFNEEVELPKKFWIALNFNAEQTKGVYVSYDTSTKGEHSRVGLAGDDKEPKAIDVAGDWMVQVLLATPKSQSDRPRSSPQVGHSTRLRFSETARQPL